MFKQLFVTAAAGEKFTLNVEGSDKVVDVLYVNDFFTPEEILKENFNPSSTDILT